MIINVVQVNYGIKGKKIGIFKEGFKDMDEEVVRVVRQVVLILEEVGVEVFDVFFFIYNDGEFFLYYLIGCIVFFFDWQVNIYVIKVK